jgi:hypothetical protein
MRGEIRIAAEPGGSRTSRQGGARMGGGGGSRRQGDGRVKAEGHLLVAGGHYHYWRPATRRVCPSCASPNKKLKPKALGFRKTTTKTKTEVEQPKAKDVQKKAPLG